MTSAIVRWFGATPSDTHRTLSLVAAVLASSLVWADTAWLFWQVASDRMVGVPYFADIGVTVGAAAVTLGIWSVGTLMLCFPTTRVPLGWLAPLGAAGALFLDQQSQADITVLVVVALSMHWWSALLTRRSRGTFAGAPLRVLQTQVSVIFGWTVVAKLNPIFMSGALLSVAFTGPVSPPEFVMKRETLVVLAVCTVIAEGFLAIALWIDRLRSFALAGAVGFHAFILLFFGPSLPLLAFALAMASGYLLFAAEPWARAPEIAHLLIQPQAFSAGHEQK